MALAVVMTVDEGDEREEPQAAPIRPARAKEPERLREVSSASRRILIAEDDTQLRRSLADIFELAGYEVTEAVDGDQAVQLLSARPEVLVLDLHMPKRDGLAVLEELGDPPPMVVLYSAFSLYQTEDLDDRGLRAKVFRILRKPAPPAQLLQAVADAIAELDR